MNSIYSVMHSGAVANIRRLISRRLVMPQGCQYSSTYEPELEIAIIRLLLTMFAAGNSYDRMMGLLANVNETTWKNVVLYLPDASFACMLLLKGRKVCVPMHRLAEAYYISAGSTRNRIAQYVRNMFSTSSALLPIVEESKALSDSDRARAALVARLDNYVSRMDPVDSPLLARSAHWMYLLEGADLPIPDSPSPMKSKVILIQRRLEESVKGELVPVPLGWVMLQYLNLCQNVESLNLTNEAFKSVLGSLSHVCGQVRADYLLHAMSMCRNNLLSPLELADVSRTLIGGRT